MSGLFPGCGNRLALSSHFPFSRHNFLINLILTKHSFIFWPTKTLYSDPELLAHTGYNRTVRVVCVCVCVYRLSTRLWLWRRSGAQRKPQHNKRQSHHHPSHGPILLFRLSQSTAMVPPFLCRCWSTKPRKTIASKY